MRVDAISTSRIDKITIVKFDKDEIMSFTLPNGFNMN